VTNKKFRNAALKVIAEQIKGLPPSHMDYASRCMCDHLLGNSEDVWKLIHALLKEGGDSTLMAFQLCFDLVDTGDQHFVAAVAKGIEGMVGEMVGDLKDGYDKCMRIMLGGFAGELELAFLYKESDSDPLIIKNLKKSLEEKVSEMTCRAGSSRQGRQ
jgi:26S proteasome regulatory subunit N2